MDMADEMNLGGQVRKNGSSPKRVGNFVAFLREGIHIRGFSEA
jgi:hypothetical protein